MKTLPTLSAAAIAAGSLGVTTVASADVSYNIGYVSEYTRGIYQKNSSASAESTTKKAVSCSGPQTSVMGSNTTCTQDRYGHRELSVGVGFTGYYYTMIGTKLTKNLR